MVHLWNFHLSLLFFHFILSIFLLMYQFSSLSRVRLFATLWITACQASLSITNSWSSLKLMSVESVMPSSHLILRYPLLLPSIPPSIRVFSDESALRVRWPKYWSFRLSVSPCSESSGLVSSGGTGGASLQQCGGSSFLCGGAFAECSPWSVSFHPHSRPVCLVSPYFSILQKRTLRIREICPKSYS